MQEANEFIASDQQVRINEFVALLLSVSIESVKSAFQKAHRIKTGTLTSQEAKARITNLKKILPVFHQLELPEMVARIESRIKQVQTFIMLILQALHDASVIQLVWQIELATVLHAIRLTEYFKVQAKKVKQYVKENELWLSHGERWLYLQNLPQEFNRNTANEIAGKNNLHLKTAEKHLEYFIKHGFLFKPGHNQYKKC